MAPRGSGDFSNAVERPNDISVREGLENYDNESMTAASGGNADVVNVPNVSDTDNYVNFLSFAFNNGSIPADGNEVVKIAFLTEDANGNTLQVMAENPPFAISLDTEWRIPPNGQGTFYLYNYDSQNTVEVDVCVSWRNPE
jgi:hypothetical protein